MAVSLLALSLYFICLSKTENYKNCDFEPPVLSFPVLDMFLKMGKITNWLNNKGNSIGDKIFLKGSTFCRSELERDTDMIKKALVGEFDFNPDANTKHFFFCEFYTKRVIDINGVFDKEQYLTRTREVERQNNSRYIDTCLDKTGSTPDETGWNIYKCLMEQKHMNELPVGFEGAECCLIETNTPRALVWVAFLRGFTSENDALKRFMYCFLIKNGYFDYDGRINHDIYKIRDKNISTTLYDNCTKDIEFASPSIAMKIAKCIYGHFP